MLISMVIFSHRKGGFWVRRKIDHTPSFSQLDFMGTGPLPLSRDFRDLLLATSGLATWRGARHVVRVPVRAPPRPRLGAFSAPPSWHSNLVSAQQRLGAPTSHCLGMFRRGGSLGAALFSSTSRGPDRRPCYPARDRSPTIRAARTSLDFPCYVAAAGLVGCGVASLTTNVVRATTSGERSAPGKTEGRVFTSV